VCLAFSVSSASRCSTWPARGCGVLGERALSTGTRHSTQRSSCAAACFTNNRNVKRAHTAESCSRFVLHRERKHAKLFYSRARAPFPMLDLASQRYQARIRTSERLLITAASKWFSNFVHVHVEAIGRGCISIPALILLCLLLTLNAISASAAGVSRTATLTTTTHFYLTLSYGLEQYASART
jgi:hypothetical protein